MDLKSRAELAERIKQLELWMLDSYFVRIF